MNTRAPHESSVSLLKTEGLTKRFGTLSAVNGVDLDVRRGDVFGFLGPNGAGKTTTIRMLLGLIRPTAGHIQIFGLDTATQLHLILPHLGALIETPVFYPYLSGRDNLRVLATRSGMPAGKASQRRIDEVFELIDLGKKATDLYRRYSLGMKQRLGLGAALLADPELVLLDEPTNGLDPAGVQEIRQLIVRLAQEGKTFLLSSHLLYEVQQVCNRVAILHQGTLLVQGRVQDILQQDQLVVRMPTSEQTERAFNVLRQVQAQGASWIKQVSHNTDHEQQAVLSVEAPIAHSPEIAGLLARHQLFVAELYHKQASLEDFFLDLTKATPVVGALAAEKHSPQSVS